MIDLSVWKPVFTNSFEWVTVGGYSRYNCPPLPTWETKIGEVNGVKWMCRVQYRETRKKFMVYFDNNIEADDSPFLRDAVVNAEEYWKAHQEVYHTVLCDYEDIPKAISHFENTIMKAEA